MHSNFDTAIQLVAIRQDELRRTAARERLARSARGRRTRRTPRTEGDRP